MIARLRLIWLLSLMVVLGILLGCTSSPPATAQVSTSPPTAIPTVLVTPIPQASLPTAGALVVTVLATDVTLKESPDDRSPSVGATFTVNGNTIRTIVAVNGDLPVLETDVVGVDGRTRWTRVRYQGRAGPRDGGTDIDTTGYLRNDLISAPHAPGAPAVRNPTVAP
jgi:hypothetical protein